MRISPRFASIVRMVAFLMTNSPRAGSPPAGAAPDADCANNGRVASPAIAAAIVPSNVRRVIFRSLLIATSPPLVISIVFSFRYGHLEPESIGRKVVYTSQKRDSDKIFCLNLAVKQFSTSHCYDTFIL